MKELFVALVCFCFIAALILVVISNMGLHKNGKKKGIEKAAVLCAMLMLTFVVALKLYTGGMAKDLMISILSNAYIIN